MRIGIDGYPLTREPRTGIPYYNWNLLRTLGAVDSTNEYILYNGLGGDLRSPHERVVSHSTGTFLAKSSTLWLMFGAHSQLESDHANVFWATQGILPWGLPTQTRTVATVYDLTYFQHPATMRWDNYLVNKLLLRRSMLSADVILTISETTAQAIRDTMQDWGKVPSIEVVYPGVNTNYTGVDRDHARSAAIRKLGMPGPFLLFIGTLEPRKNLRTLLEAFAVLRHDYALKHQLLVVGARGWKSGELTTLRRALRLSDDVLMFTGYVNEADLPLYYGAADLFVMPSLYEGFGMPVIEAMASGTPIVLSDIPVFREVAQKAAVFCSPKDSLELARTISGVLGAPERRQQLADAGRARAAEFSWERAAGKVKNLWSTLA